MCLRKIMRATKPNPSQEIDKMISPGTSARQAHLHGKKPQKKNWVTSQHSNFNNIDMQMRILAEGFNFVFVHTYIATSSV